MNRTSKIFATIVATAALLFAGSSVAHAITTFMPFQGGTGTGIAPTAGQVLVGQADGTYLPRATSTLGIVAGGGFSAASAG